MTESSTVTFPLRTARGTVSLPLTIAKVMRLGDLVPIACQLTGVVVEVAIAQKQAEGEQLSCRAGCAAWCTQTLARTCAVGDRHQSLDADHQLQKRGLGRDSNL